MRPASARRTVSCVNGPGEEHGRANLPISATTAPICSAPFVPPAASGSHLRCSRRARQQHRGFDCRALHEKPGETCVLMTENSTSPARDRKLASSELIYEPRRGHSDISVLSKSCYVRSLRRHKAVNRGMSGLARPAAYRGECRVRRLDQKKRLSHRAGARKAAQRPPWGQAVSRTAMARQRGSKSTPRARRSAWRRYQVRRDISSLSQGFLASMVRARSSIRGRPFFGGGLTLRPFLLRASPRPPRVGIISPS
jgi:hypothetical protein